MTRHLLSLRRAQLDQQLATLKGGLNLKLPSKGWIHETRVALGMSMRQLSERMGGKSAQHAYSIEKSEAEGSITIGSLRNAAEALGCELVYALVPRSSLEELVQARAAEVASDQVSRVSHTMELESQRVSSVHVRDQIRQLAGDMAAKPPRTLWDLQASR